jgi:hypothetical protein
MPSPWSGIAIAHPPPGERANKEKLMADLPEQDTEDDGEQNPQRRFASTESAVAEKR